MNEFAQQAFDGTVCGLTNKGHLVVFPPDKEKLPHPVLKLCLYVDECPGLVLLRALLDNWTFIFGRKGVALESMHFHRPDGSLVGVAIGKYGIRLTDTLLAPVENALGLVL
jgi:hypothetical protein